MKTWFYIIFFMSSVHHTYGQPIYRLPRDTFERRVIGDTLFSERRGRALPNNGLAKNRKAMEVLIQALKESFATEVKKKNSSDHTKAITLQRIAFSYHAICLYDSTTTFEDSSSRYNLLALPYARKVKDAFLINESYGNFIRNKDNNLPIRIRVLKEWIQDYNGWIHTIENKSLSSDYPHILLATIYTNIGAYDEAEHTINDMLKIATLSRDKSFANKWIAEFYKNQNREEESIKYLYEFIRYFKPMDGDISDAVSVVSAYRSIIENKIKNQKWDEAQSLIPQVEINKHCIKCNTPEIQDRIYKIVFYPTVQNIYYAQVYIGKQESEKALTYLLNIKGNSLRGSKLWADYYKLLGDTLKSYVYLERFTQQTEIWNRNTLNDQRQSSNNSFELAKSFETALIIEKAEAEKLLQNQKLIATEKQNELDKLRAESENQLLLTRAKQAELEKTVEKERLESAAAQSKKEQVFKISLLNQDLDSQKRIRWWLIAVLLSFSLFIGILVFQYKAKQKLNALLIQRNQEVEKKHIELEQTLTELKSTQAQLIQSEKMASLGELTAGIAHEIQNPLNFVNNFSELSNELFEEMQVEMDKGNNEEAKQIATDIRNNLDKINLHGKRADSIVKGMLHHSRVTSGEKQPTDINALADEFLRLAYQGLRAKDKKFNATLKTEFDPSIGKVPVISQDIGRVLLNLINNAFYAVNQKSKESVNGYDPVVTLCTRRLNNKMEISVIDNGNGISQKVVDKIFQPFFTTKPTGQGTGLGLSLSYDIIKAHGGNIDIRNTPGEGVEFIITLPIIA